MKFYQLAFRYLIRKKAKTVLLFLVLLFVSSMILSTNMILRATADSKAAIQEKMDTKIVLDILNENRKITEQDIAKIGSLEEVISWNRLSSNTAYLSDDSPITSSNSIKEDNLTVTLHSYDDLKNESAFFEARYRLIDGKYIAPNTNGIVINSLLADYNGLKLGDDMRFKTTDGKTTSAKIIGLFLSGSERKQTKSIVSANRIENQIFIDNQTYSKLFENQGYHKVAVYTKNPQQLKKLEAELETMFHDKAAMTTSDTLYRQMEVPLEQIIRVTKLMLILTFATGIIVVSLLLCMWMRTRQKETAIFISMGKSKSGIFMQVFLETLFVFILSVCGACGLGSLMANFLKSMLTSSHTSDIVLKVFLQFKDIVSLLCLGGSVVFIAVICSLIPILKANPKDTLSKMEG